MLFVVVVCISGCCISGCCLLSIYDHQQLVTLYLFQNSYQMCSIKKLFLKISQHSLENTCIGVSFYKVAVLRTATLLNIDSSTGAFQRILRNFWDHSLWKTSANGCFCCFEVVFIKMISCGIDKLFNISSWFLQSW